MESTPADNVMGPIFTISFIISIYLAYLSFEKKGNMYFFIWIGVCLLSAGLIALAGTWMGADNARIAFYSIFLTPIFDLALAMATGLEIRNIRHRNDKDQ